MSYMKKVVQFFFTNSLVLADFQIHIMDSTRFEANR